MILKKVNKNDVRQLVDGVPYDGLCNLFESRLGGSGLCFARRHVGLSELTWQAPGDDWTTLAYAPADIRQTAENVLAGAEQQLLRLLSTTPNADGIVRAALSTPTDDCVFCRSTAQGVEVCLAAWGYGPVERMPGGPLRGKATSQVVITVAFMRSGAPVSGLVFGLKTHTGLKSLTAEPDGTYQFSPYKGQRGLSLVVDGVDYEIMFEPGQTRYAVNLAPLAPPAPEPPVPAPEPELPTTVCCSVFVHHPDGTPCVGYSLSCFGIEAAPSTLVTDTAGKAQLPPLTSGTSFTLSDMRHPQHTESYVVSGPEVFDFEVPLDVLTFTIVESDETTPVVGASVKLAIGGVTIEALTDPKGQFVVDASRISSPAARLTLTQASRRFRPVDLVLDDEERRYLVVVETIERRGFPWLTLLAWVLCALVTLACYWVLMKVASHTLN